VSDIAIRVENLSKQYHIGRAQGGAGYRTLRESLTDWGKASTHWFSRNGHNENEDTIWALKDVSFEVKQGEVVGIIGRNGAGKSTLLKILSRITEPTNGTLDLYGRVGSLLEVGSGFHPELTGRENIYLNGAIIGMKRTEIERKFDEIVAFAEIEKFLDTPVKRYSSGMYVRLAFAVAAHMGADILLVDEVLTVGDAEFQKKSLGKMDDVSRSGRTVILVSHQMNAIKALCHRSLLLSKGELVAFGKTNEIVSMYSNWNKLAEWNFSMDKVQVHSPYFTPTKMCLVNESINTIEGVVSADQTVGVLIEGLIEKLHQALTVGFAVYALTGELLFWSLHTDVEKANWAPLKIGENKIIGWIPSHLLNEGDYRVELILSLHFSEWISQPGKNSPSLNLQVRGGLSKSPYWMIARPGLNAPILKFQVIK
jgi:lipopolysaccharide transport system ATP-binding protein